MKHVQICNVIPRDVTIPKCLLVVYCSNYANEHVQIVHVVRFACIYKRIRVQFEHVDGSIMIESC